MTVTQNVRSMASAVLIMRIFVEKVSIMVAISASQGSQTCAPTFVSLIMSNMHPSRDLILLTQTILY